MKPYPAYKSSGIDWIGKIPIQWNIKKLKYIASVITGTTPPKLSKDNYSDKGIPWVKPDDLIEFTPITTSKENISKKGLKYSRVVIKGSVLVCGIGTIGKLGVSGVDLVTNQQINSITFNSKTSSDFGKYMISASTDELISNSNKVVISILNKTNQENIFYPIPPFPEQTQIANYLDYKTVLIDKLIANNIKKIALLEEKKVALINHAVTKGLDPTVPMKDSGIPWIGQIPKHWLIKKIRFAFSLSTGISITKSELVDSGIDCINYGDIHTRLPIIVDQSNTLLSKITEAKIANHDSAILHAGNFVFCDTSEDLEGSGNFVMVKSVLKNKKLIAGSHTILLKPIIDIHSEYFAYLFHSKKIKTQIEQVVKGVKVYSITQSILKNIFILIPPINDQILIANHLEEKTSDITTLIEKYNQKNKLLMEYRESLISNAVTGKIDLRDEPVPEEYTQG